MSARRKPARYGLLGEARARLFRSSGALGAYGLRSVAGIAAALHRKRGSAHQPGQGTLYRG